MIEVSTRGGTRTRMPFRAKAFEASVSTIPPPGQDNTIKHNIGESSRCPSRIRTNLNLKKIANGCNQQKPTAV